MEPEIGRYTGPGSKFWYVHIPECSWYIYSDGHTENCCYPKARYKTKKEAQKAIKVWKSLQKKENKND